jgi:hypothetical protein
MFRFDIQITCNELKTNNFLQNENLSKICIFGPLADTLRFNEITFLIYDVQL